MSPIADALLVQALVTTFLALVFTLLAGHFRQRAFLAWWAISWIGYTCFLIGSVVLLLGLVDGAVGRAVLVAVSYACATLQVVAAVMGAAQYRRPGRRVGAGAAAAVMLGCLAVGAGFGAAALLQDSGMDAAVARNLARNGGSAIGYLIAAVLVFGAARATRVRSGLLTAAMFGGWAATRGLYAIVALMPDGGAQLSASLRNWTMLDILWLIGLSVAMVLLAIEEQRGTAGALAALEERMTRAQHLEAMGRMAGAVAHDFNNLLVALRVSTNLVEDELRGAPPALATALADELSALHGTLDRAEALVGQLLTFARRQPTAPVLVDVGVLVRELAPLLSRVVGPAVRLDVVVPTGQHVTRVDRGQLEQVLVNLAVNGRDAMPSGGTLTVAVTEAADGAAPPSAGWVRLRVEDSGVGMPPETLARIFEPFFTTKGERGTGLGLATVRGIVEGTGGRVEVDSAPGRGSRFDVLLPSAAS